MHLSFFVAGHRPAGAGGLQDEALLQAPLHRLSDPQENDPVTGREVIKVGRYQGHLSGRQEF